MKAYNKAISTGLNLWIIKGFFSPFSSVFLFFYKADLFRGGTPLLGKEKGLLIAK